MIELNNITKKFTLHNQGRTNISVFKNLNLKINPGEIVALTGPSGVGKSSILKMIYGNYVFQSGEIKINNYKIDYKYIAIYLSNLNTSCFFCFHRFFSIWV